MTGFFKSGLIAHWLERRRTFKQMQRLITIETEQIALQDNNPMERAKIALELGDLRTARDSFALARERMPDYVLTNPATIDVMLGLGEYDELDAFALKGAKRFRYQTHYLEGYARSAQKRGDLEEAVRRWALVRKKFRYSRGGYIDGAECLCRLKRLDDADALLNRALRVFPDDLALLIVKAKISDMRENWTEACERWDAIRTRHPQGLVGVARALFKLGRGKEAETLLAEGRYRFPLETSMPALRAQVAEEAGDHAEAAKRWAEVRERFPLQHLGYVEGLAYLRRQQDWAEADSVALAAIERFPAQAWPYADYAGLAQTRQDWPEAAKRWGAMRAAFPERQDAYQREIQALTASGQSEAAEKLRAEQKSRFPAAG